MWEGIDEPLPDGQLEVVGPSPLPYCAGQPGAARADPRRAGRDPARVRRGRRGRGAAPGSTCWSCTARTATCCPRFLSPLTNQRTDEYGGSLDEPAALSRSRSSTRCARSWPADRPMTRAHLGDRLVPRAAPTSTTRSRSPRAFADARRRRHRRLHRPGRHGRAARRSAAATRRPYADRIRHEVGGRRRRRHRRRRHLLLRRRELDPAGRPRRPVRRRPRRTCTTRTGRCTPPPSRTTPGRARPGRRRTGPGSRKPPAGRTDGPPPRLELIREPATAAPGTPAGGPADGTPGAATLRPAPVGSASSEGASRSSVRSSSTISPGEVGVVGGQVEVAVAAQRGEDDLLLAGLLAAPAPPGWQAASACVGSGAGHDALGAGELHRRPRSTRVCGDGHRLDQARARRCARAAATCRGSAARRRGSGPG